MKNFKVIVCLLTALTILCGSSMTAFATEIDESEVGETVTENEYCFDDYEYDENGDIVIRVYGFFPEETTTLGCDYSVSNVFTMSDISVPGISDLTGYKPFLVKSWYTASNGEQTWNGMWMVGKVINGTYTCGYFTPSGYVATEDSTNMNNGKYGIYFPNNDLYGRVLNTNIPIFEDAESAKAYVMENNDSGIANKKPIPENDETFAFVDFESNEYVSATWSGTTFDENAEIFDSMGFMVSAGYCYDGSGQIMDVVDLGSGSLDLKSWSRRQVALVHEDESLYLRYVSFTPYYIESGQMCKGKEEVIWLTPDGSKDYLPNGELTMIEDESFYLRGVSVENSSLGLIDGDVRSYISWTGTTKDNIICKVPLDKTYADILCLCYTSTYKPTFVDLYELDTEFMGGSPLPLRKAIDNSTQSFYINYSDIDEAATAKGLIFAGELYITPYFFYEYDNAIYKGAVTVVDVLNNELEENPDSGGIGVPDLSATPMPTMIPDTETGGDGNSGVLDDDLTFESAFGTFWQMLKAMWNGMGQFPALMYSLFPYLPQELYTVLGIVLIGVIIFRFIGR